jgi:hypothetical protein
MIRTYNNRRGTRMNALLLAAVILTLSPLAHGQDSKPMDFNGISQGDDENKIKKAFPKVNCRDNTGSVYDRICLDAQNSIAGRPARAEFALITGQVETIRVQFDSEDFAEVVSALKQKYGKPDDEGRSGRAYVWNRGATRIVVLKPQDPAAESTILFMPATAGQN